MATWKKIAVSGSAISQFNNDSGYLTAATVGVPNSFATASFNGTSILADTITGSLNFASSSGQGLNISADAGTDTLTFGLGSIPNSSLANSTATLGTSTITLGAATTTVDGLTLTNTVATGSFTGSFTGDGTGLTGLATTLTIDADAGGTSTVDLQSQTLDIAGTANEIETSVSAQTITVGLPNDVVIGNDLTVTGDLKVNGTTTNLNVTNLDIEDKFILLSSGSGGASEGGIIIDQGSFTGEAFAYDTGQSRFGFTGSLASNATAIAPDAFVAAVVDEQNGGTDIAKYQKNGNIRVDSSGEIWIYS